MNWRTEWHAVADRIKGFVAASTLFLQGNGGMTNPDSYLTRRKHLLPAARRIYSTIESFLSVHQSSLPLTARETVQAFLSNGKKVFTTEDLDSSEVVLAAAVALEGFRAELQYQLTDLAAVTLRTTERAFTHLQRQVVADSGYRSTWSAAFSEGEVACERLGSVHLLQQGIWAFKVSAEGGRTDLVFQNPLGDLEEVARAADALVLTEWKLVRSGKELTDKIREARTQTALYTSGVLGGLELANYRYLVMVSEHALEMPPDEGASGIQFRHRNIAVDPESPSRTARRPAP